MQVYYVRCVLYNLPTQTIPFLNFMSLWNKFELLNTPAIIQAECENK
jgi:hypothetical protein